MYFNFQICLNFRNKRKIISWGVMFFSQFSQSNIYSIYVGGIQVILVNHCTQSVWPGVQGTGGHPAPNRGGFHMGPMEEAFFEVPFGWSGRVWARQGCFFDQNGNGTCQTGNCGGQLHCNGLGTSPPATIVLLSLSSVILYLFYYINYDYHDVLVSIIN